MPVSQKRQRRQLRDEEIRASRKRERTVTFDQLRTELIEDILDELEFPKNTVRIRFRVNLMHIHSNAPSILVCGVYDANEDWLGDVLIDGSGRYDNDESDVERCIWFFLDRLENMRYI